MDADFGDDGFGDDGFGDSFSTGDEGGDDGVETFSFFDSSARVTGVAVVGSISAVVDIVTVGC